MKSSHKILEFLQEWQSEFHLYNLMSFHSMEIYDELEQQPYLEEMWDYNLTPYFKDKFNSFSTEGGTGYFAFWEYPNLNGDAPIVLLTTGGIEPALLAGSLNDLICKMIHNIGFNSGGEIDKKPSNEELEEIYYDVINEYESEYNKEVSLEEIQLLIKKDREEFKKRALRVIDFINEEQIEKNIKKHPSFVKKFKMFDSKNDELLPNASPFKATLEDLPKAFRRV